MGSKKGGKQEKKSSAQSIGFQFNAPLTAETQTFVNGDVDNLNIHRGLSVNELRQLDVLFQPLKEQIQLLPQEKQGDAEEKVEELHAELAKGQGANASRLNQVVDTLVEMVPGALSAVVSMFATPVLGALVGPATSLVLDHLKK
jgi:hypothetical protein